MLTELNDSRQKIECAYEGRQDRIMPALSARNGAGSNECFLTTFLTTGDLDARYCKRSVQPI
jgi:hypothetical protein